MEKIKMTPFTPKDYECFAGAGENAHIGEFTMADVDGDPTWECFSGPWTIVADSYGVGLYFDDLKGNEAIMTWLTPTERTTESLAFIATNMKPIMTPSELMVAGFVVDIVESYTRLDHEEEEVQE